MIVIRSAICKHNCRSPEVLFLDFEFTPGLGFVVGGLYNSGLNRTELVFLDGWECTPSIVGLWSLPGSNSTGSWVHVVGGVVLLVVMSNSASTNLN